MFWSLLCFLLFLTGGCLAAAGGVSAFLAAARDDDDEAHIDILAGLLLFMFACVAIAGAVTIGPGL